jgi:hypothetical protein
MIFRGPVQQQVLSEERYSAMPRLCLLDWTGGFAFWFWRGGRSS